MSERKAECQHSERRHYARGLCHSCWKREYIKANPEAKQKAYANAKAWKDRNRERYSSQQRNRTLERTFGITSEEYDIILANQNGVCAICEIPSTRRLHVDHDHDSGKVRGLLCARCNTCLEHAVKYQESMNIYLARPPAQMKVDVR